MTACDRETGQLFLAGQLDDEREAAFTDHVESCRCCRSWLEADAGDPISWQMARELSSGSVVPVGSTGQFGAKDQLTPPRPLDCVPQFIKPYLSASDDPSMMGRLGSYEIVGVIGRGGMGIVLKAFERPLNRFIAIKVLEPALASFGTARKRFAREAKAMAAISHEHVVPIYAVDQHQGLPYFVMEYVVGGTLEDRIRDDGPLDLVSIVRIGIQVAEALAAAHAQGLVHRDIKPGNILLDRGTERVRVADFGLARVASDASETRSGLVAGTPQYMSPEQVRGEACDARSDLFSLGSLMYAMSAGHAPFQAETVYGVMQRIVNNDARGIRQTNDDLPAWLERFVRRLLQREPEQRFESAEAVAVHLQLELAYLQNPTQVKQPVRDWDVKGNGTAIRKRWQVFAGVAALLLIGIGAVAFPFYGANRLPDPHAAPLETTNHNPAPQPSPSSGVRSTGPVASLPPPLWSVDGTSETFARTRELQSSFLERAESLDIWTHEVDRIRQRLNELQQDPFSQFLEIESGTTLERSKR